MANPMTAEKPQKTIQKKPMLSFWQIWNMSFGFLGIQFGFALQNANVSRIFETLGASVDEIPILWVAAPVTGLIVQPIIGYMSDNTWTKLGRRRPYFLVGAILASIALFIMPNSPVLWVAAGMLWIMDASINVSMEPFRAFVGDMLPSVQRTAAFAMQSFFIGTGAVIASALPYMMTNWLGIENTANTGLIPPSVKFSFYFGGIVYFLAVAWTVYSTKEYSPGELDKYSQDESSEENKSKKFVPIDGNTLLRKSLIWLITGIGLTILFFVNSVDKELYILSFGLILFGIVQIVAGILTNSGKIKNGFVEVVNDMFKMPRTMQQLAVVQFFSWFSLFSMWIYTTSAVTAHLYGTKDTTSALYNEGADWVGVGFAIYNGFAALVAFLLPVMAKYTSRKTVHAFALIAGGIGLASIYILTDPAYLLVSMLGVGLAWASILSLPYAILAGALPANKMGVYMGIFNFFIVIPQIIAAGLLGYIVRTFFDKEAVFGLVIGGASMILAAILMKFVDDVDEV